MNPLAWIAVLVPAFLAREMPASNPCASATAKAVLVQPGEPGEPLRVSGTVFLPDGVTPAPGVFLYAYQTDVTGRYAPPPATIPRIHGWMRTDENGRYEFRTIRPAPYPNRQTAAHIHTHLWGLEVPPQWNRDLLFADDPLLSDAARRQSASLGRFGSVHRLRRGADGVQTATFDIRLKPAGETFERNILHGVEPCGVRPSTR